MQKNSNPIRTSRGTHSETCTARLHIRPPPTPAFSEWIFPQTMTKRVAGWHRPGQTRRVVRPAEGRGGPGIAEAADCLPLHLLGDDGPRSLPRGPRWLVGGRAQRPIIQYGHFLHILSTLA